MKNEKTLNALLERALERFTDVELLEALDTALYQNKSNHPDEYIHTLYDLLKGYWGTDEILEHITDYDDSIIVVKTNNIQEKHDIEQLIKNYTSNN